MEKNSYVKKNPDEKQQKLSVLSWTKETHNSISFMTSGSTTASANCRILEAYVVDASRK
jgi:hypothetical protein